MEKPRMGRVVTDTALPILLSTVKVLEKNPQGALGSML